MMKLLKNAIIHLFLLAVVFSICVVYLALNRRIDVIDAIFFEADAKITDLKYRFYRSLSVESELRLEPGGGVFDEFCVFPAEIDPRDFALRMFGPDMTLRDSFGLLGWNDNNWHIVARSGRVAYIVSMKGWQFPFVGETVCSEKIVIEFNRVTKLVEVSKGGD